jgi:thioredoxin domain-containing protein 5
MKSLYILFLLITLTLSFTTASDVKILTEQNFDHDVQPSAGTSGDWFIEFYAPWCGHCQRLQPVWEQVASELKQEVNVAKVDVTTNDSLGRRFGIRGFPTLKFIRHGLVYDYKGDRSFEALVEFARQGYINAEGSPVPGVPTIMTMLKDEIAELGNQLKQIAIGYPAAAVSFFSIGLLFGVVISFILFTLFVNNNQSIPPTSRVHQAARPIPTTAGTTTAKAPAPAANVTASTTPSTVSDAAETSDSSSSSPSQASIRKRTPRVD